MDTEKGARLKDGDKPTENPSAKSSLSRLSERFVAKWLWIPANWSWSKWKPVLRCALAAWAGLLLFLIPKTLDLMGQAAFLIIIAAFLSPPGDPFIAVLQRELGILAFSASGWAWSCLGMKLADLARSNKVPVPSPDGIFSGQYIEAAPTVIISVFLFIGTFFFLYIKSRIGPGPLTIACIFGCICVDICLTTAVLFPYPYYTSGQLVLLPLSFHSAIALILSLGLFPTSESAVFTARLQGVLSFLVSATKEHHQRLQQNVTASDFSAAAIIGSVSKAESALALLASAARLQRLDVVYCRFSPLDYTRIHVLTRQLVVKAGGMSLYYALIDPTREKFTPAPPISATPTLASPSHSHPLPMDQGESSPGAEDVDGHGMVAETKRHQNHQNHHSHHGSHGHRHVHHTGVHHRKRHQSPLKHVVSRHAAHSTALSRVAGTQSAVGVFESVRYLNLEAEHMFHPESAMHITRATELLSASCSDLLESCQHGLEGACDWLSRTQSSHFNFWVGQKEKQRIRKARIKKYEGLHRELSLTLDEFTSKKRLTVLDPHRSLITSGDEEWTERENVPHRHLFNCFVYQYHLIQFAASIQTMLSEIIRLETSREMPRVWFPMINWSKLIHRTTWEPSEMVEEDDDENPDTIPGLDPTSPMVLGQAVRRDPDALPPRNILEKTVNWIYYVARDMGGGNVLFALKAGVLTILLSLPSFLTSTAGFAYRNKFVWAVIMGQLTLSRFRGDTTFGLVARIVSTFIGGIIGTLMWYISAGSGHGNPFSLAAVCLVCFPFFFFFRLYWPVSPMTNLIIWVTSALVYGYSYLDTHITPASASSPGHGIGVTWRRFVLVVVGVVAAGIFSFFPPSTTIRLYERKTLATTTSEIGSVYCSVIASAYTKSEGETAAIVQHILAILSKLKRSIVLKENAVYEFSLRGEWPAERYQRVLELQIQIAGLLSHLASVLERLEPAWAQAFLKRTRMSDPDFLGDVLAVISMTSSSLRSGNPLPQVTPCPLVNRMLVLQHGMNVVHEESEEDFGLPKVLTEETLESLQYLTFCVGVSTTFALMTRLDNLMVAVKELVGEQYHIHGIGLPLYTHRGPYGGDNLETSSRVSTVAPGSNA